MLIASMMEREGSIEEIHAYSGSAHVMRVVTFEIHSFV